MMDHGEKALRTTALLEIFVGLGRAVTTEQLAYYGNLTRHVPLEVFRAACNLAVIGAKDGWPPGPGDIIRAALTLAPGPLNPGHERSLPRWYQRATYQLRGDEQPREIGRRSGVTDIRDATRVATERSR
jgi:hypothetical protein